MQPSLMAAAAAAASTSAVAIVPLTSQPTGSTRTPPERGSGRAGETDDEAQSLSLLKLLDPVLENEKYAKFVTFDVKTRLRDYLSTLLPASVDRYNCPEERQNFLGESQSQRLTRAQHLVRQVQRRFDQLLYLGSQPSAFPRGYGEVGEFLCEFPMYVNCDFQRIASESTHFIFFNKPFDTRVDVPKEALESGGLECSRAKRTWPEEWTCADEYEDILKAKLEDVRGGILQSSTTLEEQSPNSQLRKKLQSGNGLKNGRNKSQKSVLGHTPQDEHALQHGEARHEDGEQCDSTTVYLCHQLDHITSGCIAFAKCRLAAAFVSFCLENRLAKKEYVAIVLGHVRLASTDGFSSESSNSRHSAGLESGENADCTDSWRIRFSIARAPPSFRVQIASNQPKALFPATTPVEGLPSVDSLTSSASYATETVVTIDKLGFLEGWPVTQLKLYPVTGRRHQLRVLCSDILKAPILGDVTYYSSVPPNATRISSASALNNHYVRPRTEQATKAEARPSTNENMCIKGHTPCLMGKDGLMEGLDGGRRGDESRRGTDSGAVAVLRNCPKEELVRPAQKLTAKTEMTGFPEYFRTCLHAFRLRLPLRLPQVKGSNRFRHFCSNAGCSDCETDITEDHNRSGLFVTEDAVVIQAGLGPSWPQITQAGHASDVVKS